MARNQSDPRGASSEGRNANGEDDRNYDYRYTRNDEGDSSVRAGSYDQGRAQYGRRDSNEQNGSGRYDGTGDFGQGDNGGGEGGSRGRFESDPQDRYSQGTFGTERSGGNRGPGVHRGKGPKGYQRSDERLNEMVCERLREDPDIDASEITVSVQDGRVTLEGTVDSRHARNLAEDAAEQLGASDVQNNLRVQQPGLSGQVQRNN